MTMRHTNLKKHDVGFAGYTVTAEDARETYQEQRFVSLGLLQGVVVSVTK